MSPRQLIRLRRRTASLLWAEAIARSLALPAAILLTYIALALFGLAAPWLFALSLAAALIALIARARRIHRPHPAEIDRRIEAASGLRHRPLATLADRPATNSPIAEQLWHLHQARIAASLASARSGWPAPFASAQDPFSLRALLLLLLATGLVINGAYMPARLASAFAFPAWPFAAPQINAWITPPAYTGQGPILLSPGTNITTLAGSRLSIILNASSAPIRLAGAPLAEADLGPQSRRADATLTTTATLAIGPWWHRLARWDITVTPPAAPTITLNPVQPASTGVALSWRAADPYGLSALALSIRPPGYPDALPEGATLPAATGPGAAVLETADSPYAGISVTLKLRATNLAGLSTISAPQTIILPPPRLADPTAITLSIIRQNLALTPGQSPAIARQMMQLAAAPPSAISYAIDLQLAALAAALHHNATAVPETVTRLLPLIQQIEAGPDYAPARALAQASQNLLRALAHGPPDSATLNKLLQAMQQALAQHLAAISPPASGQPAAGQPFNTSALNQLAAQIAADEQAGRTAQAQAELQQLAQALQALQSAKPMTAAQAAQSQAASQAAAGLSQLLQAEAALLDQTAKGAATPGQQSALQSSLNAIRQSLARAGIPALPGLGPANQSMSAATAALAQQNNPAAQGEEQSAIQNLQKAASALQQSTQQGLSVTSGGMTPDQYINGDSPNGAGTDTDNPGLNLQTNNPATAIEQEIIRQDANPALPAATHAYLKRLLTPDP